MKPHAWITCTLALLTPVAAYADSMVISTAASRPSVRGVDGNFTGAVVIDPIYAPNADTPNSGGSVTFAPGA